MTASKELYRRWIGEAWSKGNVDALDDMNTPDFADHSGLPGVSPDTAGMKQFIAGLHAAFSEVALTIEDMVAEGGRLAVTQPDSGHTDACVLRVQIGGDAEDCNRDHPNAPAAVLYFRPA